MTEHTKGPWRRSGLVIAGPRDGEQRFHAQVMPTKRSMLTEDECAEMEADARLMEVAPELLAACESALFNANRGGRCVFCMAGPNDAHDERCPALAIRAALVAAKEGEA